VPVVLLNSGCGRLATTVDIFPVSRLDVVGLRSLSRFPPPAHLFFLLLLPHYAIPFIGSDCSSQFAISSLQGIEQIRCH